MNKRILIFFIKDRMNFSIIFFINTFLIILFFYLSLGNKVEIIYPITISAFLYIILIIIEWIKYYKFNSNLFKAIDNFNYDLRPSTCEQKEVSTLIDNLHSTYMNSISTINTSNQSQKHFLSQWIHNMKTPISVIDLIMQKTDLDLSDSYKVFESIREENNKLSNNLEQVLNYIRLEDFSKDYVPESIDLLASVRKVINSKKNHFIYSNVYPKVQCESEKVLVLSDSKWNEIMLEQLVSNAIKYSNCGETSKNVYFIINQKGNITTLEIKDEGIGIPESDIGRIFEPFFTGENGRKIRNATGIGLYICSVISEKLGLALEVQSEVDTGTTVCISYLSKM